MLKKILRRIIKYYAIKEFSINDFSLNYVRNIEIIRIDDERIKLIYPHGILGEDVLLREQNNLNSIEYMNGTIYYFDFINVSHIDSIGVGYITKQIKDIKCVKASYKFINVNNQVKEVFDLLGFNNLLV